MPTSQRAPRALYFTDTYPPQLNGVSVVTASGRRVARPTRVGRRSRRARVSGAASDPFARNRVGDAAMGVTTIPSMPMPGYSDIRLSLPARSRIRRLVDRFRPDIVHCATEFLIGRTGQQVALQRGIPVVSSYHTDFSRYADAYGAPWLREPVRRYLARFHARSRRVYTPGSPAARELEAGGLTDVEVWGRGVDIDLFHPDRRSASLREAYGVRDGFLLLHVGRLAAEKGVERILHAFAAARASAPAGRPMHLVVAGVGPRESALRALASEGVFFLGNLDRTTMLPQLYASCSMRLVFAPPHGNTRPGHSRGHGERPAGHRGASWRRGRPSAGSGQSDRGMRPATSPA